jgi:RNA polymerase sigma-70 factor (ECF subfamily)
MSAPTDTIEMERFQYYLTLIARSQISNGFAAKIDIDGLVQDTLLEAFQAGHGFPQSNPEAQLRWLRRALTCNIADAYRKLGSAARDVKREQSLDAAIEDSALKIANWLAADQSTPSSQADRAEQLGQLARAMRELSSQQREAIEMHHLQGQSLAEVGTKLGRSREAVAGLLARGLKRLRELLRDG